VLSVTRTFERRNAAKRVFADRPDRGGLQVRRQAHLERRSRHPRPLDDRRIIGGVNSVPDPHRAQIQRFPDVRGRAGLAGVEGDRDVELAREREAGGVRGSRMALVAREVHADDALREIPVRQFHRRDRRRRRRGPHTAEDQPPLHPRLRRPSASPASAASTASSAGNPEAVQSVGAKRVSK